MQPLTIHLIPNAHLDPVWLWDWREGLNEAWQTCRTVLALMDEFPALTFVRGEAAVYQHIEEHDPVTFRRIQKAVRAGRWDVVGGTWIQPDTNLPATETFTRHFLRGQRYFQTRFGQTARVAWAADSFGHSGGLPDILAAAGIEGIAFTRTGTVIPPQPAFWWQGVGGARVLAYRPPSGWYGCERAEMKERLDSSLELGRSTGLQNVACFYGLGNHGGGPTRRHLREIQEWIRQHPGVNVAHSGLHRLFGALRQEKTKRPEVRGELNYCLRGCYSAVAKFKFSYRQTEALLARAERTDTAIRAATKTKPADLREPWDTVLFNSFHDILPGSSIERALDEQIAALGGAQTAARRAELNALNVLAARVDTTVPAVAGDLPAAVPFLVWNPHPHEFVGHVELEASLDARPIWKYKDHVADVPVEIRGPDRRPVPFQLVGTEHTSMPELPWRKRAVVPVKLPPLGWSVFTLGYVENPQLAPAPSEVAAPQPGVITNGDYQVAVTGGQETIAITRAGQPVTTLALLTLDDPWGSWGGMAEEKESLDISTIRHRWTVTQFETLEKGPERALLWVQLTGGNSRVELSLALYRDRAAVDVAARVLWNERSARLKLVMTNAGASAEFEIPGGTIQRGPAGEVPGGRWVRTVQFGFASDALYNFDLKDGALRATICRASRYANDVHTAPAATPWLPAVDAGELKFRFLIAPADDRLPGRAFELEEPPVTQTVPPRPGKLPRRGSLGSANMRLLALKPAEDGKGTIVRLQNVGRTRRTASLQWGGKKIALGPLKPGEMATWRVFGSKAKRVSVTEC